MKMIAAVGRDFEIGKNNALPWKCPADLTVFKHLTLDHTVIMGANTAKSLGRPLPDRHNIVLTRDASSHVGDLEGFDTVSSAKEAALLFPDAWVIGGAQVYEAMLPYVSEVWLSHISVETKAPDTFFPVDKMIGMGFKFSHISCEHVAENKGLSFKQVVYKVPKQ